MTDFSKRELKKGPVSAPSNKRINILILGAAQETFLKILSITERRFSRLDSTKYMRSSTI